MFCWRIISHIYLHETLLHFFCFTSNNFNRITLSLPLWSFIAVKVNYNSISASWPGCGFIRQTVYVLMTYNIPHYFKFFFAFICFTLPIQISLTVLQNLNHNEASHPSRRTTQPDQPVRRNAALYVRLYTIRLNIISHLYTNKSLLPLFYCTTTNKFNRITVS